ncbi:MAG: MarC family protein [Desulfurivibrio sp.]|nr:MarC family protein [Desulfurivibrio sp.]
MFELAIIALTTFFVTVGPVDVAVIFAILTRSQPASQRRVMARRGTLMAAAILLIFALFGEASLAVLGITLPALYTAGGILLLLIGIDMVFARSSGGVSTTDAETREAASRADLAVFPLATPLLAGPGAISAAILLMSKASGDWLAQGIVLGALLVVMLLTFLCLLLATHIQRFLGVTGSHVLSRILGMMLCALAMQFIFDGLAESGLLS